MNRAWIELNAEALENNLRNYQNQLPTGMKVMAVVKANDYGHGAKAIAPQLERLGIDFFAVAALNEALELRECGIRSEILILGYTDPSYFGTLADYNLTQTVTGPESAAALEAYCRLSGRKVKVHVAVDTGMHRIGYLPEQMEEIAKLYASDALAVTGIYSHLCVADTEEEEHVEFSLKQIDTYRKVIDTLEAKGLKLGCRHLLASYPAVNYQEHPYDYARLGVLLMGVISSPKDYLKNDLHLQPVMQLKAHITAVREIGEGESVSYGRIFRAERPTKVASVAIGYADGLPRCLSTKLRAIVNGNYVPQIGRICMDQLMLDVTDIPEVRVGDVATFIGREGDCVIYAEELAEKAGTITNEFICRLGSRLEGRTFTR